VPSSDAEGAPGGAPFGMPCLMTLVGPRFAVLRLRAWLMLKRQRRTSSKEIVWAVTAVVGLALALLLPARLATALGLALAVVAVAALGFSLSNSQACEIDSSCPTSERVAEWIDEALFFPAPIVIVVGLGRLALGRTGPGRSTGALEER
jgi:hypothetical protein